MYRRLNNELRRETEKARENCLKDKCEEQERAGKFEMMYQVAKELIFQRRKNCAKMQIVNMDGTLVIEPEEVLKHWKEYTCLLYTSRCV